MSMEDILLHSVTYSLEAKCCLTQYIHIKVRGMLHKCRACMHSAVYHHDIIKAGLMRQLAGSTCLCSHLILIGGCTCTVYETLYAAWHDLIHPPLRNVQSLNSFQEIVTVVQPQRSIYKWSHRHYQPEQTAPSLSLQQCCGYSQRFNPQ